MRKAKQLLWFIIPSVLIWVSITIDVISIRHNTPKFIGTTQYFRLFLYDPTFKKALFNTMLKLILIILLISIALYAAKRIVGQKLIPKYANTAFYIIIILLITAGGYLKLHSFLGNPYYNLWSIFSTLAFLVSLQIAILFCFIFWCIDLIFDKIGKPKCDENTL